MCTESFMITWLLVELIMMLTEICSFRGPALNSTFGMVCQGELQGRPSVEIRYDCRGALQDRRCNCKVLAPDWR